MIGDLLEQLRWLAYTVYMEAEGEPYEGKLGVAYAICARARSKKRSVSDVVFQGWQFSAWNTESPTRLKLDEISAGLWADCYKASVAAYFELSADPTGGATHYLNVEATKAARGGTLPKWAADSTDATKVNEALVTARLGHHTFLRDPP